MFLPKESNDVILVSLSPSSSSPAPLVSSYGTAVGSTVASELEAAVTLLVPYSGDSPIFSDSSSDVSLSSILADPLLSTFSEISESSEACYEVGSGASPDTLILTLLPV